MIDDDGVVCCVGIVVGCVLCVVDCDGDVWGECEFDLWLFFRVVWVCYGGERRVREFVRGTRVVRGTIVDDGDGVGVGVESVVVIVIDVGVVWDVVVVGECVESEFIVDVYDERGVGDGEDWVLSRRRRGE